MHAQAPGACRIGRPLRKPARKLNPPPALPPIVKIKTTKSLMPAKLCDYLFLEPLVSTSLQTRGCSLRGRGTSLTLKYTYQTSSVVAQSWGALQTALPHCASSIVGILFSSLFFRRINLVTNQLSSNFNCCSYTFFYAVLCTVRSGKDVCIRRATGDKPQHTRKIAITVDTLPKRRYAEG